VSELDLGLKINSRRLLWQMGFSTRVDVPLRTPIPANQLKGPTSQHETFTDLDVLGVSIVPGFDIRRVIADCKTSQRGSTERMFWIRGVSDFFRADDAWMVRDKSVTAASRQLADRLHISVLEPADLEKLREFHPTALDLETGPLSVLFDETSLSSYLKAFTTIDKKLDKLLEYRQFDYWVMDEYRNLQQVVAHLSNVKQVLDPSNSVHRALFLDCAWLYSLSIAQAARQVRAVHVMDVDGALQQYLFGGQAGLLEKRRLATMLSRLAPPSSGAAEGVLPGWYPLLLELLVRHLRRPNAILAELQYAEWLAEAQVAKDSSSASAAFGQSFDPLPAKLLADICGFLVSATGIDPGFRDMSREALAPGQASEEKPAEGSREVETLFEIESGADTSDSTDAG
jgi:hypothetical protein